MNERWAARLGFAVLFVGLQRIAETIYSGFASDVSAEY